MQQCVYWYIGISLHIRPLDGEGPLGPQGLQDLQGSCNPFGRRGGLRRQGAPSSHVEIIMVYV